MRTIPYFSTTEKLSLQDALDCRSNIWILNKAYQDKLDPFYEDFLAYACQYKDEFLNDASAFYPKNPVTNKCGSLKREFKYLIDNSGTKEAEYSQYWARFELAIHLLLKAVDFKLNLDEYFKSLQQFWKNRRNRSFYQDASEILEFRNLLQSYEKLDRVGLNLKSAIYVSQAS